MRGVGNRCFIVAAAAACSSPSPALSDALDSGIEVRDAFVRLCFMQDISRSEDPDALSLIWGYERVIPEDADVRRFYKGTLTSGRSALLSFLDAQTGHHDRGTCSFTVVDADASSVRRAILLWQGENRPIADRIVGDERQTFWRVQYAGYNGTVFMEETVTSASVTVSLTKVEN